MTATALSGLAKEEITHATEIVETDALGVRRIAAMISSMQVM